MVIGWEEEVTLVDLRFDFVFHLSTFKFYSV